MSVLVIAEHDGKQLKPGTTNTIAAAAKIGGDIAVLVAGHNCGEAAQAATKIAGVVKVLHADATHYAGGVAENVADRFEFPYVAHGRARSVCIEKIDASSL